MPNPATERPPCELCGGVGFIRTGPNASELCRCQLQAGIDARIKRANFPANFQTVSFDTFTIDDHNRAAKMKADLYVSHFTPGKTTVGLLFTGTVGTGKTYLAVAIARQLIADRGIEARFVDIRELLDRLRSSYDSDAAESQAKILAPILSADLVIIDELGAARGSDWVFETQELLIGKLYNQMTPVIVTTNLPNLQAGAAAEGNSYARAARPETLGDRIGARMFSRLQQMAVPVAIAGPDRRAARRADR